MNRNGAIIYQGPSLLDGAPIVAIVTGLKRPSANDKTGDMLQTWILRADEPPSVALESGADASICGDCQHRPDADGKRSCYVLVYKAPRAIWGCFAKGRYPRAETSRELWDMGAGRAVRLGAYGDPAAVPAAVWQALVSGAETWTGYTHQWPCSPSGLRSLAMASVDSPEERENAKAAGWRTFRVRTGDQPVEPGEIVCPASPEGGHKSNCAKCGLCQGAPAGDRKRPLPDIVTYAHGKGARAFTERQA